MIILLPGECLVGSVGAWKGACCNKSVSETLSETRESLLLLILFIGVGGPSPFRLAMRIIVGVRRVGVGVGVASSGFRL